MKPSNHSTWLLSLLSVVALLALAPSDARAQEDEARKHYDAGVAAMEGGDCVAAEAEFEKAMAIKPHYQIAGNLGACELELKKYQEAAEHLHWALEALKNEAGREREKEALGQMLERSRLQVGSLRIAVSGHAAEQAKITLDGAPLDPVPDLLFVTPGKHSVEASAPGAEKVAVEVNAAAGETVAVALPLKEATAATPTDGPGEGEQEQADEGVEVGPIVFWSTLAGGGVFLGLAIGLHVAGSVMQGEADDLRDEIRASGGDCADDCPELVGKYEDADGVYNAAVVSYVIAGVLVVGAVIDGITLLMSDDGEGEEAQARLRPSFAVTPNGDAFIGLSGQF